MPYSNWRRHNSPSIPQTPYQTLIIPCPNFDPIYQVILLENSNEWNLSPAKKGSSEKRERSKDWKAKEVKPHLKKLHVSKKGRGWDLQAAGRDSVKRKKERRSHFPTVQNPMCGLIHTHTSFAFALPCIPWLFPFLPPFTTPFSTNHNYLPHKLFRIFLCFYNIQGVA
jgi:hypothetical protein